MAVGLPLKTTYANGDVYSASDVNDTNGTINLTAAPFAAGKNKIINGDFKVWQRGTSFTVGGSFAYTADRFGSSINGTGVCTISRQTFTPGTAPVAGYEGEYFLRSAKTAGTANTYGGLVNTRIEDVRILAGQTVTLSFWAKADSSTAISAYLEQNFGSGGSATVLALSTTNYTLTTSWQRFSTTFTMPALTGKTIGTSSYLDLGFFKTTASAYTIDMWGIQLEASSIATAFQTATGTIQGELAACQRYYEKNYNIGTAAGSNITGTTTTISEAGSPIVQVPVSGTAGSTRGRSVPQPYKVSKRVAPTIRFWDLAGNINRYTSANVNGNFVADNRALDTFGAVYTISDWAFGWQTVAANSADIYCGIMWEASAEL